MKEERANVSESSDEAADLDVKMELLSMIDRANENLHYLLGLSIEEYIPRARNIAKARERAYHSFPQSCSGEANTEMVWPERHSIDSMSDTDRNFIQSSELIASSNRGVPSRETAPSYGPKAIATSHAQAGDLAGNERMAHYDMFFKKAKLLSDSKSTASMLVLLCMLTRTAGFPIDPATAMDRDSAVVINRRRNRTRSEILSHFIHKYTRARSKMTTHRKGLQKAEREWSESGDYLERIVKEGISDFEVQAVDDYGDPEARLMIKKSQKFTGTPKSDEMGDTHEPR